MNRWLAAIAAVALVGCSQSLDDQQKALERFVRSHRHGSYADMWLVRNGLFGPERVALIYGMAPDSEFCNEVAAMYMIKYPQGAVYTCEAAN